MDNPETQATMCKTKGKQTKTKKKTITKQNQNRRLKDVHQEPHQGYPLCDDDRRVFVATTST